MRKSSTDQARLWDKKRRRQMSYQPMTVTELRDLRRLLARLSLDMSMGRGFVCDRELETVDELCSVLINETPE